MCIRDRHLATLQDGATAAAIDAANASVRGIITAAHPVLVDCRPAGEAMGLEERVVLHAGPPLQWNRACPTMQAAVLCAIRYEGLSLIHISEPTRLLSI